MKIHPSLALSPQSKESLCFSQKRAKNPDNDCGASRQKKEKKFARCAYVLVLLHQKSIRLSAWVLPAVEDVHVSVERAESWHVIKRQSMTRPEKLGC